MDELMKLDSSIWVVIGSIVGSLVTALSVIKAERIKAEGLERQRRADAEQAIAEATVSVNEAAERMAKNIAMEMTRLQKRLNEMDAKVKEQEKIIAELEEKNRAMLNTLRKQSTTIAELEAANKKLEQELIEARSALVDETIESKKRISTLRKQYEATIDLLNQRIEELERMVKITGEDNDNRNL